jgi:hypothetical protein
MSADTPRLSTCNIIGQTCLDATYQPPDSHRWLAREALEYHFATEPVLLRQEKKFVKAAGRSFLRRSRAVSATKRAQNAENQFKSACDLSAAS